MDNYSFLADLLNKFHTSLPWIQFIWIAAISIFLLNLGWCIKEIFVAFAKRAKPEGELVCTIYRNNEDKFLAYSHKTPYELMDSNNILKRLIGGKSKQIEGEITEKANNDGKK